MTAYRQSDRRPHIFKGAAGNALAADLRGPDKAAPVLLLHGGGQTRRAWDRVADRIAATGLLAVTLDQRGHGDSAWVESGAYRFFDFADDATAVAAQLREMTGARPIAVGASLGGIASLLAHHRHGGVFAAIVLVDITPTIDPKGVSRITGFMRAHMEEGFATLEEAANVIATYLPDRKRAPRPSGLRKNLRQDADGRYRWHWDPRFIDGKMSVQQGEAREAAQAGLIAAAGALDIPALLVRGGNSDLVGEEHVREFLDLAPHAEFVDVTGAGHMVAGDKNDAFGDAVLAFLGRTAGG